MAENASIELLGPGSELDLTEDQEKALATELSTVIDQHKTDIQEFLRGLVIHRRLYEMKSRVKTFPWPGAANFIIPIITFVVDYYKAQIEQGFRQAKDLWHGSVLGSKTEDEAAGIDWKEIATDAAIALNYLSKNTKHINIHEVIEEVADFLPKDGTCPIKVHYIEDPDESLTPLSDLPDTTEEIGDEEAGRQQPKVGRVAWDPIDITRFVWRVGARGLKDSKLKGHWTQVSEADLRDWIVEGKVDKMKAEAVLQGADDPWFFEEERLLDEDLGIRQSPANVNASTNTFRIHEISIKWRLDDKKKHQPIRVWWHQKSATILRAYIPEDFADDYEMARFTKRGRQFLGRGIAEPLKSLNLGTNASVNQTVDSATIGNAHGYAYKGDSRAADFLAAARIYPGMGVPTDENPKDEFMTFSLGKGNIAPSMGLIQFFMQMAQLLGKVGPSQLGQTSAGSRVSASVGLGILQEGATLRDSIFSRLRDTFERCGYRSLYLYARHNPGVFDEMLDRERATRLIDVLSDPGMGFQKKVNIALTVTSSSASKEKDKQDLVVLANFFSGVMDKIGEKLVPAMSSPNIPPEAKRVFALLYKGFAEVVKPLVESFDQFKDGNEVLSPEIMEIFEQMAENQQPGLSIPSEQAPGLPLGPEAAGAAGAEVPVIG